MAKTSKRFKAALEQVDGEKQYALKDAIALLQSLKPVKFDETVELYARLGVDPKQTTQMVRGTVRLPHGSGKEIKVVVFTENAEEALQAGADEAGMDDLIAKVQGGWMDFDVAVATKSAMTKVRALARQLGPRGLMPNPKTGTVTEDVAGTVKEVKAGRIEYKMDKTANCAMVTGKKSFSADQLADNLKAVIDSLVKAKPEGLKGEYIKSLTLSATMSPGIALDMKSVMAEL